jgi:ABC-type nitrate/sulfonate/bicarbonate transport system substrate-binding protein
MNTFKVALDWTANTNHSGFYVAQKKGFYKAEGLAVTLDTPDRDNYKLTPAKKVEMGLADAALCPFESVLSYNTKANIFNGVAIASIFREDVSAIAVLKKNNITRPKELDQKSYASYQARYEDHIVAQMIKNDGGEGIIKINFPEKLGIWETLLSGRFDATWIFRNWEGIHAKNKGIPLRTFTMADFGIPYSYSPVLFAGRNEVEKRETDYKSFLKATKQGFLYAQENPSFAADCIKPFVAESDKDIDLVESQEYTNPFYGDATNWGILEEDNVNSFLEWIKTNDLEKTSLEYKDLVLTGLI